MSCFAPQLEETAHIHATPLSSSHMLSEYGRCGDVIIAAGCMVEVEVR
jgi:hypothetical protein